MWLWWSVQLGAGETGTPWTTGTVGVTRPGRCTGVGAMKTVGSFTRTAWMVGRLGSEYKGESETKWDENCVVFTHQEAHGRGPGTEDRVAREQVSV